MDCLPTLSTNKSEVIQLKTTDKESRPVHVAVVGLGYWGPKLARVFNGLETAQLYAGCDKDEASLARFRQTHAGVLTTTAYASLLDDPQVDAIAVATPIDSHYALAREALLKRKHVLVEKPMTAHGGEADDLVKLAGQNGCVLMVDHTYLYGNGIIAVKSVLEQGEIGHIHFIDMQRNNFGEVKPAFSAMWELAPHDLAILVHLLGVGPFTVQAQGGCYLQHGIEDVVHLWLTFPGEIRVHVGTTWLAPRKERQMTIVGSRGMLVYREDPQGESVQVYSKKYVAVPANGQAYPGVAITHHPGTMRQVPLGKIEPLQRECQHFIDCIVEGRHPISDGRQGSLVCCALESAQRSLASGGTNEPVPVPADLCIDQRPSQPVFA